MAMDPTVVSGVGMHPFGRFGDKSPIEMGVEALRDALADGGVEWGEVDALFCAHMYAGTGAGHKIATALGRTGIPIVNVENACSSGGAAISVLLSTVRVAFMSGTPVLRWVRWVVPARPK